MKICVSPALSTGSNSGIQVSRVARIDVTATGLTEDAARVAGHCALACGRRVVVSADDMHDALRYVARTFFERFDLDVRLPAALERGADLRGVFCGVQFPTFATLDGHYQLYGVITQRGGEERAQPRIRGNVGSPHNERRSPFTCEARRAPGHC